MMEEATGLLKQIAASIEETQKQSQYISEQVAGMRMCLSALIGTIDIDTARKAEKIIRETRDEVVSEHGDLRGYSEVISDVLNVLKQRAL